MLSDQFLPPLSSPATNLLTTTAIIYFCNIIGVYSPFHVGVIKGCHWCIHAHNHSSQKDTPDRVVTTVRIWALSLLIRFVKAASHVAPITAAVKKKYVNVPEVTSAGMSLVIAPTLHRRERNSNSLRKPESQQIKDVGNQTKL